MPTTRSSSTPTRSTTSMATALKAQLENSTSSTIYVPLDEGDTPTDDELKALAADGLHAEIDAVRGALAVRAATDDEIAAATAPTPEPEPASQPSSSSA